MSWTPKPLPFSDEQKALYERACAALDKLRMRDLLADLVNIHSPTGAEAKASKYLQEYLKNAGFRSSFQQTGPEAGNAWGRYGDPTGPSLILYAPIDTHLEANPDYDLPYAGQKLRADMIPEAVVDGDLVIGLGAANPKCMVACLVEAAHAVRLADIPLKGELITATAGSGMPVDMYNRYHAGRSSGVVQMLTSGVWPDFALIVKPWWVVYAEEPGIAWFKVQVRGDLGYAGIPRGVPNYRSSIVPAAGVIQRIEAFLPEYTKRNTAGTVEPHGAISCVQAGWPDKPAFPSAATDIYLDMRINPRTTPADVRAQFAAFMEVLGQECPDLDFAWDMVGSAPGGMTDVDNFVVQSALRAWEMVEGAPHGEPPKMAGQTDGAIIRRLGIPTARIGYPWPSPHIPKEYMTGGLGGMGAAWMPDMMKTAKAIVYVIIDTLMRDRQEVGL